MRPRLISNSNNKLTLALFIAFVCAGGLRASEVGSDTPRVRVENVRRAFHNGEHNAFTDLIRWGGKYWLTFRSSPDGHQNFPSSIIVLCSDDTREWRQAHRFSVPERDTRDPHFVVFQDRLFVYSSAWNLGGASRPADYTKDWNRNLGYGVWTKDGVNWSAPKAMEGTFGHYVWRAAAYGGKVYICARRWREHRPGADRSTMEAALLESEDGLTWRFVSLIQETHGNETAFLIDGDGRWVGVSRSTEMQNNSELATLTHSRAPFREWNRLNITVSGYLGGPMLARWAGRLIVGARQTTASGRKTTLSWLVGNRLVLCAELPSAGDNSYPGFVQLDDGRGLVSWYSSHEKGADGNPITAIYLADLALDK